jgi:uncharacterized membrane protein YkvA (DUF1232 family)
MKAHLHRFQSWAAALKHDVMTLWFAMKHPLTPLGARLLAAIVTAYALSPIDLIPDFIPILGYLDDLIIVPLGIWLLLKMIPGQVLCESRYEADKWQRQKRRKPQSVAGLVIILSIWVAAAWVTYQFVTD